MKNWLNKLGFRRMDEMERQIAYKARRNAYVFLVGALLVWTLYDSGLVFARQTIIAIENNKYDPSLELAVRQARRLDTPVEELFTLEDNR